MKPEPGVRYGAMGNDLRRLMLHARMTIDAGHLISVLRHKRHLINYAWYWPADHIPNPDSVEKIGEFVT